LENKRWFLLDYCPALLVLRLFLGLTGLLGCGSRFLAGSGASSLGAFGLGVVLEKASPILMAAAPTHSPLRAVFFPHLRQSLFAFCRGPFFVWWVFAGARLVGRTFADTEFAIRTANLGVAARGLTAPAPLATLTPLATGTTFATGAPLFATTLTTACRCIVGESAVVASVAEALLEAPTWLTGATRLEFQPLLCGVTVRCAVGVLLMMVVLLVPFPTTSTTWLTFSGLWFCLVVVIPFALVVGALWVLVA